MHLAKFKAFRCLILAAAFLGFSITGLQAQQLEDFLSRYTSANGEAYMQPLANAFGANTNSGWYSSGHVKTYGVTFRLSIETFLAGISDDQKTFMATTEGTFQPATTVEAPTIFGSTEGATVEGESGTFYAFPGGLDIGAVLMAVPQLTVGTLFGTEATLRWFSADLGEDLGKLTLLGIGARHNLNQHLTFLPFDLAVGYFSQSFDLGTILEAKSSLYGLQAGIQRSIFDFYGGLGRETSSMDISYIFEDGDESEEVAFELDGENNTRFTLGIGLNIPGIKLHADYSIAKQKVFVLGLAFGSR